VLGWRRGMVWWVIAAVLVAGGGVLVGVGLSNQRHAPQPTAAQAQPDTTTASVTPPTPTASPGAPSSPARALRGARSGSSRPAPTSPPPLVLPRSVPVSIRIPSIGVRSSLLRLGLNADRSIQVPPPYEKDSHAGWYRFSSTPGQLGPAVILGHVDSAKYGPAVFFELGALQRGKTVEITLTDATVAVFTVDKVVAYPKSNFPTAAVYGNIDHAGLRLITCGGTFDPHAGGYQSNIVAYATLTSSYHSS